MGKHSFIPLAIVAALCVSPLQAGSAKSRFVQHLEAGKKQTLVAYGTSLSAVGAWVDQLRTVAEQQFPGLVTVVNGAQGGANSDWGRENLDNKVLAHHPDTLLIEFSVNDAVAKRKTSVDHARENLENMIGRVLEANPDAEIILMVMNPPVGHCATERPNLAAFNQMYRDVANQRGFQLIDHFPAWENLMKKNPALFLQCMPDAIHPMRIGSLEVSAPLVIRSLGLSPGELAANRDAPMERYLFWGLMDKDKDGRVTVEEFDAYWSGQFENTDTDRNGSLNESEIHSPELFALFDSNHDAQVDLDEYLPKFRSTFERHADATTQTINRKQ